MIGPLHDVSNGDGIDDGAEDNGGGSSSYNGRYDNGTETNASYNDTDGDGLRAAERTQRAGESPALAKALLAM